jgi:hypothetical protein
MEAAQRIEWAALALALAAGLSGCGTPGAPQPPSLNLPDRVADLAAARAGDHVALAWTMPKKNTDKLLLKGEIVVRVCHKEGAGSCEPSGARLQFAPGAKGTFTDTLAPALAAGAPRALTYFVELVNRNGRSAGLSNGAIVLAGKSPEPVSDLRLAVRKEGVALHWTPDATQAAVRLHRTLLTPPKRDANPEKGPLAPAPEPLEQNLLVEGGASAGQALDRTVRFGETYEYRAQHVVLATVDKETIELAGELCAPVRVEILDVFPPAVPTGLAAVATAPEPGVEGAQTQPSIDLSWQPVTDADLAGYIVYRREGGAEWQRISPTQPQPGMIAPAFHDAHVVSGHTYVYAVSAIDQKGHESALSAEAQETVPGP